MKQDDLYTIIQNMTKQEKIFFNRYAQVANNKKNKHYMSLFKLIERQLKKHNAVDEKLLKEKFQYLSVEKRYLANILINALTAFHEKKDGFYLAKTWIKQIRILIDKGAFTKAQKLHTKAVALAEKHGLFEDLMILSNLKIDLCDSRAFVSDMSKTEDMIQEKQGYINQTTNYDQYRLLHNQILDWTKKYGYIDSESKQQVFDSLVEKPLMYDIKYALSDRAKKAYFIIKTYACILNYDSLGHYKVCKAFNVFIEEHPHLYDAYNKIIFTYNYVSCCIGIGNLEESQTQLKSLDEQIEAYSSRVGYMQGFSYMSHLRLNSQFGLFEQHPILIKKVEAGLDQYQDISPEQLEFIALYLGRAYMELGDYEKALDYLYKIREYKALGNDSIHYSASKLLMLICYYELGWDSNLESMMNSFYRQIRQNNIQFKLYESFLKYLKNKSVYGDKGILETYYSEWERYEQDVRERIPFQYFHYKEWLKGKIENKSLNAYFQQ